jgi:hypothetical protein
MIRLTKKLENKYFIDSLKEEKILNCEDGYRLVTIKVFDCLEAEGIKLSEILVDLYSEEVTMYLYDYSFYCEEDQFFEFQVCIDEEYIKEFNKLYREFKKSVDDLLETEEEEEILKAEEEIIETEEDVILEEVIEVKEEAKKETKYQIGQYLYNCGDMANNSEWYKITNITIDKFGTFYDVEEIGGNRKNNYPEYCISEVDRMNGSTRIVTMEAKIKATNESYVYNQINALLEKDHDERIEIVSKDYDERMKLIENEDEENKDESTEDFKIVKLDGDTTFGNGNVNFEHEYTIFNKNLGYASMSGRTPYIPLGGKDALKELMNENLLEIIPHWIKSSTFKYTYQSRGFSPFCQPMNGLIGHENQKEYKFEVLTYNRKLTCKELAEFELIDLNE